MKLAQAPTLLVALAPFLSGSNNNSTGNVPNLYGISGNKEAR